jgi:hypothetical protein
MNVAEDDDRFAVAAAALRSRRRKRLPLMTF